MITNESFLKNLTKFDDTILKFFLMLLITLFSFTVIINLYVGSELNQIVDSLYFCLLITFIITGILVFRYHSKRGIISSKKIFKRFGIIAAVSAPIFTIILSLYILSTTNDPNLTAWSYASFAAIIGLYIGMFLAVFLSFTIFIFFSFGMIGILAVLERRLIPETLHDISKITSKISETTKNKDKKGSYGYYVLRWLFNIPDVLDTKTLTIQYQKPSKQFPWATLKKAMMWQLLLGIIVIIYISFNPFFLESISFETLFYIATNITLFIPLIILPWFIFLKIDAKIKGQVKDFQLYRGIVYRMYQTFITLGTIIIIIRLAIKNINPREVMTVLPIYFVFFILIVFFLTFVYFNYFEDDLAKDIADSYKEIKN